jgi:nitrogen fixation/metabolism regulation signal transduction histidine kinase
MADRPDELMDIDELPFVRGKEPSDEEIQEAEKRFSSLLRVITEDARQLSEYLLSEASTIEQVCRFLETILSELNLSVVIPQKAVPTVENSKEIILNSQCHLIIVQKDGSVESKSLGNYPPETILAVVCALIPRLKEEVSAYLRKVSVRLNFLEMVKEELKNIQKPFVRAEEVPAGEFREEKAKEIFVPQ